MLHNISPSSRCWMWDGLCHPLTIITIIIHSVTVPLPLAMSAPNTCQCWAPAQQYSASSVSTSINEYQLSIKLAVSSNWQKSPCQVTLQEKWPLRCLWCRITAELSHQCSQQNLWGRKALARGSVSVHLFPYIVYSASILKLYWANLNRKLKSMSPLRHDLSLDRPSLLIIAYIKQQIFCS